MGEMPRIIKSKTPVLMSWSGGKDSAVALHELVTSGLYEVVALMTTVSEQFRRISHHGVREELLEEQADALGLPLHKIYLPSANARPCTNEVYEQIMADAMAGFLARGVRTVAFGDLFLEDLRIWREASLAKAGMEAIFPIWKRSSTSLAKEVIAMGYKAYLSCVDGKLGAGFAGRAYDLDLLRDLPTWTDPCGENGEFHSFVYDGPMFLRPVEVQVGEIVMRDGRHYADLMSSSSTTMVACRTESIPPV